MAGLRRRVAARPALLVAVLLLVGACGVEPQRSPEPVPGDRLPVVSPSPALVDVDRGRVWGARDQRLVPVFVALPDGRTVSRVEALLELAEPDQRPPTALRPGTRLTGFEQRGDLVVLDLSPEIRQVPAGELPLALGQLVLTVTEQPGVVRVHVRSDGVPVRYVDATGAVIGRALVRPDFAILVEEDDGGS